MGLEIHEDPPAPPAKREPVRRRDETVVINLNPRLGGYMEKRNAFVKRVQELLAISLSMKQMVQILNSEKLTTPTGKKVSVNNLSNWTYAGWREQKK